MIGLSYSIKMWAEVPFVLSQFTRVIDSRTDISLILKTALHIALHRCSAIKITKLKSNATNYGYFTNGTLRLLDSSPTVWPFRLRLPFCHLVSE